MAKRKKKYRIVTPSESENLGLIRDFVGRLAHRAGFNEDHVNKIQVAVDEACTNVVQHAYPNGPAGPIDVEVVCNSEKFQIAISDKGVGFHPETLEKPNMVDYLNEFKKGGLGIHLIQTLMDEVSFRIQPRKKNTVFMTKYINREETPEELKRQAIVLEKTRKLR